MAVTTRSKRVRSGGSVAGRGAEYFGEGEDEDEAAAVAAAAVAAAAAAAAVDDDDEEEEVDGCSPDDLADEPRLTASNTLTVHNVLASASLTGEPRLDLDRCSLVLGNSYYNPTEFPALRIEVRDKRRHSLFSISLFESGRIQSTGGCYPIEAKRAMVKISRRINSCCGYHTKLVQFEIQNILAVYDTGVSVALPHFVQTYQGIVDYEPERFPAARVRVPIPKAAPAAAGAAPAASSGSSGAVASSTQNEASGAGGLDGDNVNAKIRRLMLGEDSTVAHSSTVGGYAIGTNSLRRSTGGKADGDKVPRAEAVHANVFSTGKVTFTGAKSVESLSYALEHIRPFMMGRPTQLPPRPRPAGPFVGGVVNLDQQFVMPPGSSTGVVTRSASLMQPLPPPRPAYGQAMPAAEGHVAAAARQAHF